MTYFLEHDNVGGSGNFILGIAGEDLGDRKMVYLTISGTWMLADADAAASMPAVGLTMHAFSSGKPGWILTDGWIGLSTWTWTAGTAFGMRSPHDLAARVLGGGNRRTRASAAFGAGFCVAFSEFSRSKF